ncbi:MAG TPA: Eco57I restriction-modification methylase domain-containing protein, partial [Nannocystis sp.]
MSRSRPATDLAHPRGPPRAADPRRHPQRGPPRAADERPPAPRSPPSPAARHEQRESPRAVDERRRHGQHYTQPPIVDLINAFSIRAGTDVVLDPACGAGVFLVRAYARKRHLQPELSHRELLAALHGCDLLDHACQRSARNLAACGPPDDPSPPRIHHGDFLALSPNSVFARPAAGGPPIRLPAAACDAIVGNPPYIRATELPMKRREAYRAAAARAWPEFAWSGTADIFVWFFTHSARFLKPGGYLSFVTQSAWLDGEYGAPLRSWLLQHFKIVAILESEVEAWFSDARVATAVAILVREPDPSARTRNLVRFVQFRAPLPEPPPDADEATRQRIAEDLRDAILAARPDDPRFRVRVCEQSALEFAHPSGTRPHKWGRHLRALDTLYALQRARPARFCALAELAHVERGVTTNCDDFFLVRDVTADALAQERSAARFESKYHVPRDDVLAGRVRIAQRSDGARFPLEPAHLRPSLKTARDLTARCTSQIDARTCVVVLRGSRDALSPLARAYVRAGEARGFHRAPSFAGRPDWYVLRTGEVAPILFVKTIQYTPQLLWNDAGLLANQRLYNIFPRPGVDPELLAAALSSTLLCAERLAGVKPLGREAASDVDVKSARGFRLPDPRHLDPAARERLVLAYRRLRTRPIGSLLPRDELASTLDTWPDRLAPDTSPHDLAAGPDAWPDELRDPD